MTGPGERDKPGRERAESAATDPGVPAAGATPAPAGSELLAAVFESNVAALAVVSGPELRVERANPAFRALLPAKLEPAGRRFEEVWPSSDPVLLPALRRALATGEPFDGEDHAVSLGEGLRRFSLHVKRVESSGAGALLVVLWETTAVRDAQHLAEVAAQRALRRASELEAIVDALPDAFVIYGPRGEILRMNAPAERLLALSRGERELPVAARWGRYAVWTAEGRPVALSDTPVARALAGEVVRGVHLKIEAPGGTAWLLAGAAPIRAPGGAIWGAVLTFSDESALHALEEARDDLARMISHDLRTPLNAVLAQAQLLRRQPGDAAKVEERARSITRSCDRMSGMIQDLLEATLLEAGQLRMSPRALDLAALVPEVVERLRGALPVERVTVRVPPAAPLVADPARLERILVNLVSNALKYSPPQSPVDVEVALAEGGATITVADRGIGIAPEDLPHVFDRFFRARGARQPEGLGLGLYITRLLANAHGGKVEVESYLGTGSAFRVFLPAQGPLPTPPLRP